jgi:hypothetical protein
MEPTGVPLTDADGQQVFVDILAHDVIKPLEMLKVSLEKSLFGRNPCLNGRVVWKESNEKTREAIENNLKISTSWYADHAENCVSKLQQAYSRKYQPQQYAHAVNVSQSPQDVPNKRFGRRMSALFRGQREDPREPEPSPSDEGIADVTRGF